MITRGVVALCSGSLVFCSHSRPTRTPKLVARPVSTVTSVGRRAPADRLDPPKATTPTPIPNPLVSRHKPVFGHSLVQDETFSGANDGVFGAWDSGFRIGWPKHKEPGWVAIRVGDAFKKLLLVWTEGGPDYNNTTYGAPADYLVQVSANSTDGANGTWRTVARVEQNQLHARGHSFDFEGQSFVKMVFLRAPAHSANGIALDELELFDLSSGGTDSWVFMGDSITAATYRWNTKDQSPSFPELVHRGAPDHYPAIINAGIGGENSSHGLEHIDDWLSANPDFTYWAIAYGTNDAASNTEHTGYFEDNMRALVERVVAAGRVPILARIPYAADGEHDYIPRFNDVIDRLSREEGLWPGPDLYAWFLQHPTMLRDQLHPGDAGIVAINRLWWQAVRPLYAKSVR